MHWKSDLFITNIISVGMTYFEKCKFEVTHSLYTLCLKRFFQVSLMIYSDEELYGSQVICGTGGTCNQNFVWL